MRKYFNMSKQLTNFMQMTRVSLLLQQSNLSLGAMNLLQSCHALIWIMSSLILFLSVAFFYVDAFLLLFMRCDATVSWGDRKSTP